jgi:hypothetical protein
MERACLMVRPPAWIKNDVTLILQNHVVSNMLNALYHIKKGLSKEIEFFQM